MKHEEILKLGWVDRHPNSINKNNPTFIFEAKGFDYHIMSVAFNYEGNFHLVMIQCVPEKTESNEWENSETHFYGQIKEVSELKDIMRFIGVIEY